MERHQCVGRRGKKKGRSGEGNGWTGYETILAWMTTDDTPCLLGVCGFTGGLYSHGVSGCRACWSGSSVFDALWPVVDLLFSVVPRLRFVRLNSKVVSRVESTTLVRC